MGATHASASLLSGACGRAATRPPALAGAGAGGISWDGIVAICSSTLSLQRPITTMPLLLHARRYHRAYLVPRHWGGDVSRTLLRRLGLGGACLHFWLCFGSRFTRPNYRAPILSIYTSMISCSSSCLYVLYSTGPLTLPAFLQHLYLLPCLVDEAACLLLLVCPASASFNTITMLPPHPHYVPGCLCFWQDVAAGILTRISHCLCFSAWRGGRRHCGRRRGDWQDGLRPRSRLNASAPRWAGTGLPCFRCIGWGG